MSENWLKVLEVNELENEEAKEITLENGKKIWNCLMKLMFFGATAICICKRQ